MRETSQTSEAQSLTLAQRGLRGAAWTYGGAGIVIVAQLAYTALTARLISPAEFGAYATAQALLMVVGYFTLATVGNAIIRQPSIDRRAIGTAIVLTAIAGSAVAIAVVILAGLWAELWRSPGAVSLLRLYAPQIIFSALAIVPLSLLRRSLRYRTASLIETSAVLTGFGLGALLALELRSAEALVMAQVVTAAALSVFAGLATRTQLALAFSRSDARSLFSFSAQVSLQNLDHYVNNTLPSFAISRSLGPTSLGYFSRGSLLVGLPQTFLNQGVYKTLYPIYPRFRESAADCRRMMVDVTSVTATLVWPLFGALAGFAPLVVDLLLGQSWAPVTSIVGPLCLYASANFAYSIFVSFAESFGYLRQIWLVQACWTLSLVAGLAVVVTADVDMRTIVLLAVFIQLAVHALQMALLGRTGYIDVAGTLRVEAWAASLAVIWFLCTTATTSVVDTRGMATRVISSGIVLVVLAMATWLVFPRLPAGKAFARRGIRVTWGRRGSVRIREAR